MFTINLSSGIASVTTTDSMMTIIKDSDDAVGAILKFFKSRPTGNQTLAGDVIGEMDFYGNRDTDVQTLQAKIKAVSSNNVTASVQGAYILFEGTTLGAASPAEWMRLIDAKLGIGTTSPDYSLHVKGTGAKIEKSSDDAVGSKLIKKKKRIAGTGQVQSGDVISTESHLSMDNTSAEIEVAVIETTALELHTTTAQGTGLKIKTKKTGSASLTTRIDVKTDFVNIPDLEVGTVSNTEIGYLDGVTSAIQTQLGNKISSTEKGAVSGVCPLNASSLIDSVYLPSYVDDVLEYANLAALPGTGVAGIIYVTIDTNKTYRWTGSVYVEISSSLTDTLLSSTAFTLSNARHFEAQLATDSTTTGANASLAAFTAGLVRLTDASLTSLANIPAGANGQILNLINRTGVDIDIIDSVDAVGTAANRIFTGAAGSITMTKDSGLSLVYDTTSVRWNLVGGSGTGGGGGGSGVVWTEGSGASPLRTYTDGLKLLSFDNSSTQEIYALIAVPSTYKTGKPITLKGGQFFCNTTTGKVFFKTDCALIKSTTVLGTYPNIRTSTNTVVTVAGVANTNNAIGDFDVTSTTGTINSVAVLVGDKIRIRLYRDNSAEAGGAGSASADAQIMADALELKFS
jgi:hypothetical protein